jgi:chromosomal replication initiation ATPase DnaA
MSADGRQLPLDLPLEPRFGAEDFLVSGSNDNAYAMIEAWPQWPDGTLALAGPPGSGKSHLAAIWAERSRARQVPLAALQDSDVETLVAGGAVVLDHDGLGAIPETPMFHLLNLARERAASVLLTGRAAPGDWQVATKDLASRLRRCPVVAISEPDDALIRALLVKLFVDRQIVVDTALIGYLALRIDRSFEAVRRTVAMLDRETMARGKRLTRAMAARILGDEEGA